MKGKRKLRGYATISFCWVVKIAGLAVFLLILAIFIGEGPPNPFELATRELVLMFFFFTTWAGLGLALWRQLIGGILILTGIAAFTIIAGPQHSWVFHSFWLLGILNLLCWFAHKAKKRIIESTLDGEGEKE